VFFEFSWILLKRLVTVKTNAGFFLILRWDQSYKPFFYLGFSTPAGLYFVSHAMV